MMERQRGHEPSPRTSLNGVLDVFSSDAKAHDVFGSLASSDRVDEGSKTWLPGYATLSHGLLELHHDPRLFREHRAEPAHLVHLQQPLMGLSISGGRVYGCPVFISKLPDELAAQQRASGGGEINLHDEILAVNGIQLSGAESHEDVADLLQRADAFEPIRLMLRTGSRQHHDESGSADMDRDVRSDAGSGSPPYSVRWTCSLPLAATSVWRDLDVIRDRYASAELDDVDADSGRYFCLLTLSSTDSSCCLFRARTAEEADKWCSSLQENVRNLLRETMFDANTALQGNVGISNIHHLAWTRTWLLENEDSPAPAPVLPHQRPSASREIKLIAITDTTVNVYDRHPPIPDRVSGPSSDEGESNKSRWAGDIVAFWNRPSVPPLPIVQSRLVYRHAQGERRSQPVEDGDRSRFVILRTGLEHGLEQRVLMSDARLETVLLKTEFQIVWQVIPKTLLNKSFSALWHGEQCSIVLDQEAAISIYVEGSRQKRMSVPFDSIKRTSDDKQSRFHIGLDSQSCITFRFDGSSRPFQSALITYLAFHKSGIRQRESE